MNCFAKKLFQIYLKGIELIHLAPKPVAESERDATEAETTEEDLIEEDTQDLQSNIETAKSICKEIGFKIGFYRFSYYF